MDESAEIKLAQMIKFDAEDMLPAEYRHRVRDEKQPGECSLLLESDLYELKDGSYGCAQNGKKNTSKIDPQEWVKAPVFIPRQTMPQPLYAPINGCANPFEVTPPASYFHDKHLLPNFSSIPPDSTANYMTTTDSSQPRAPPSTTIILRKKRRLPPPKRFANGPLRFDILPYEPMVGGEAVVRTNFSGLQSPIVRTSVNVLGTKIIFSSAIDRYSLRREGMSPSLPDVINGQIKGTASEADLNQTREQSIHPITASTQTTNGPHLAASNGLLTNLDSSSCPDLSDNQLQLWDNILSSAVQRAKDMYKLLDNNSNVVVDNPEDEDGEMDSATFQKMTASTVMNTSVYELCPPAVFDALDVAVHADGISSKELRRLDKNMAGCSLEDSFNEKNMVDRLQKLPENRMTIHSNPAYVSLHRTLASELLESNQQNFQDESESDEDVIFKPDIPNYAYPQLNNAKVFMTTFDPKAKKIMSVMDPISKCSNASAESHDLEQLDCYEGMRIQVNAFGECDDVALSEAECPAPSRFQQLQWAVQRHKNQYFETKLPNVAMGTDQLPQRVCCEIM